MTAKINGWRRIAFIATTIVALAAVLAVIQPFVPWAPKDLVITTFAMAAENTLDRWRSELIKLKFLVEQTKNSGDQISQASWEKQLLAVQLKIKTLETEKARRK